MSKAEITKTPRLTALINDVQPLSTQHMTLVQERLDSLTKPLGSLGRLEEFAKQLAGIQRTASPTANLAAVTVMAGDHGVTEEGVSPYPSAVTTQMVANFLAGGAAVNTLAKTVGAAVYVADIGVASDWPADINQEQLFVKKVRYGTANMTKTPALSIEEATAAIFAGAEVAENLVSKGHRVLAVGEMGIGNTTPATALLCVFTGLDPEEVTGQGCGLDAAGVRHKAGVIRKALALHQPKASDPLGALAAVGGLEIAGMAGYMLRAAALHCPIVVDGFITTAAAMVACTLCPGLQPYLIASHVSQEPGHKAMLSHLKLHPSLHLEMRLGEGTGAVLMLPILQAATRILTDMATFAEAGVSTRAK